MRVQVTHVTSTSSVYEPPVSHTHHVTPGGCYRPSHQETTAFVSVDQELKPE